MTPTDWHVLTAFTFVIAWTLGYALMRDHAAEYLETWVLTWQVINGMSHLTLPPRILPPVPTSTDPALLAQCADQMSAAQYVAHHRV